MKKVYYVLKLSMTMNLEYSKSMMKTNM